MKKWLCLALVGVLLIGLTACGGKSDVQSATGEYNGQTITMSYKVTDVVYPWDMRSLSMQQGYAVFYDYTWYKEYEETGVKPYPGDTCNILDKEGNRLFDEPYTNLAPFNSEGKTVAQKQDGTYVSLNTKLEETPITEQDHLAFCLDSENNPCNKGYPESEKNTSCVNEGLAIYVETGEDTISRAGLMDEKGKVIIPAFIPVRFNTMTEHLHLEEDITLVEDHETNNIGIITVTRS